MGKDALIVGAGIGGLTAAHALGQAGWQTHIYEQAPAFAEIGAGIQLSPNATRILRRLGLLEAIRAQAFEPTHATIRDGIRGQTLMAAPLKGFCERIYGAPYLHVYRPDLHQVLRQGLDVHLGQPVLDYDRPGIEMPGYIAWYDSTSHLVLENGEKPGFCNMDNDPGMFLIVGADGLRSTLQARMNGPEAPSFTGQSAA